MDNTIIPGLLNDIKSMTRNGNNEICCKLRDLTTAIETGGSSTAPTVTTHFSTADTNDTLVYNTETNVISVIMTNTAGSDAFVKLYNNATAPVVGTTVPYITLMVPANSTEKIDFTPYLNFSSGLGLGITGVVTVADTTAVGANEVTVTIITQ